MPWEISKQDDKYCVVKSDTDEVEKCYDTEAEAEDYMAALYANVEEETIFKKLMRNLTELGQSMGFIPKPIEEAISIDNTYDQIWSIAEEQDPWVWVSNMYYDDDGSLFAILASEGKLFRSDVTVSEGVVSMGDWVEVKIDFPKVEQARTQVIRQKDGTYRWFSISCVATLNRVSHIDSRDLFDSFVANAEETGEYPIRQFYHAGEQFRTGQCDYMGRDDYLLITSGVYDDTELARREVEARMKEPEYWGDSIGFYPTTQPEMLEISEGIEIPVYTEGICYEISTLPESQAASWMTATPTLKEVTRMLKGAQKEAFIKLFENEEDPEAAAEAWLAENADTRNRAIVDAGMITRNTSEPDGEPEEEPVEETVEELEPEEAQEPQVAVLDDDAMTEIVSRLSENIETKLLEGFNQAIDALTVRVDELQHIMEGQTQDTNARLDTLELDEAKKRDLWREDLPAGNAITLSYRPRQGKDEDEPEEPVSQQEITDAQVAPILANIDVKY